MAEERGRGASASSGSSSSPRAASGKAIEREFEEAAQARRPPRAHRGARPGLTLTALAFRDLVCLAEGAPEAVLAVDRRPTLAGDARGRDPRRLREAAERCEEARQSLELNVTEDLALSALGLPAGGARGLGAELAKCDPFGTPSTSRWTGAAITCEVVADEDLHRHAVENLSQADALLFGRVTYEMMEAAWRPPRRAGARPDWMEPFARTIDAAKKYVVSSTLEQVDWNAELVRGDLGKAVQQLKQEPGKGLFVGGVKLPLALAELGLIDEYEFVVHPRLAGHGPTLFAGCRSMST